MEVEMPDIAMCTNRTCDDRGVCHRYLAVPSPHRQSYMSVTRDPGAVCRKFAPVQTGDVLCTLEDADRRNTRG